jgi:hypothetical protein
MAFIIDKTVEINAPAEVVWDVITDLPRYGEWNPFVLECRSTLKPGEPIVMKVKLGMMTQTADEVIQDVRPKSHLSYHMKPVGPGVLSSYRSHNIESVDTTHSRYHSHFELKGWLMPLVRLLMGKNMRDGFVGMTDGIKRRAEQLWAQQQAGTRA